MTRSAQFDPGDPLELQLLEVLEAAAEVAGRALRSAHPALTDDGPWALQMRWQPAHVWAAAAVTDQLEGLAAALNRYRLARRHDADESVQQSLF